MRQIIYLYDLPLPPHPRRLLTIPPDPKKSNRKIKKIRQPPIQPRSPQPPPNRRTAELFCLFPPKRLLCDGLYYIVASRSDGDARGARFITPGSSTSKYFLKAMHAAPAYTTPQPPTMPPLTPTNAFSKVCARGPWKSLHARPANAAARQPKYNI